MQPLLVPEFSFGWVQLLGEELLFQAVKTQGLGTQYAQLLADLSLFLQELGSKQLRKMPESKKFFRMTLQLYLKLQKQIPEFLSEEGLYLLEELPRKMPELESVILSSASPRKAHKGGPESSFN